MYRGDDNGAVLLQEKVVIFFVLQEVDVKAGTSSSTSSEPEKWRTPKKATKLAPVS